MPWTVVCILAISSLIAAIVAMMTQRVPLTVPVLLLAITAVLACIPLR